MSDIRFYVIPTSLIHIESSHLTPTPWDNAVQFDDLVHFVGMTGRIQASPRVTQRGDVIYLKNGEPFVRAAVAAKPSLTSIVCESNSGTLTGPGVRSVPLGDLLAEQEQDLAKPAINALYFCRLLNSNELAVVRQFLDSFNTPSTPEPLIEDYQSRTEKSKSCITWKARALSGDDARIRRLIAGLGREIHPKIPISSWNGIDMRWLMAGSGK